MPGPNKTQLIKIANPWGKFRDFVMFLKILRLIF